MKNKVEGSDIKNPQIRETILIGIIKSQAQDIILFLPIQFINCSKLYKTWVICVEISTCRFRPNRNLVNTRYENIFSREQPL